MEIKHTIEILTKDIQDIENLVRNLKNYPEPPQIELDLAMSKLRRVYELIYMISNDRKAEVESSMPESPERMVKSVEELSSDLDAAEPAEEEEKEEGIVGEGNVSPKEEEAPAEKEETSVAEEIVQAKDEQAQVEENILPFDELDSPIAEDAIHSGEEIISSDAEEGEALFKDDEVDSLKEKTETGENQAESAPEETPEKESSEKKESAILAEKFAKESSINEKIAGAKDTDLGTAIKGGAIDSIKRNIGINDRFLIIRELMNGDNEGFNQLLLKLDECTNFNESFKHIESRFPDNLEHEGVKILINLSRRKFISSGNV